jgi:outer membrane protein
MHKIFSFVLIFIFLTGFTAYTADTINKGDVLDLQQCIDIALQKHPSLNAAAGTIRAGESKIGQARAGYYPQLTFQSNYQRIGPYSSLQYFEFKPEYF